MAAPSMLGPDGDPTQIIGTGPFRFVDWVPDDHFTVERNDDYWGEPPHLDGIDFSFLSDPETRHAALDAGDIDGMITPEPSTIRDYRDTDGIVSYESSSEPAHIVLNSEAPPFDNVLARQAIAYGTDQEGVITALDGDGILAPSSSPFVPANPWHLDDNGWPAFDEDKAADFAAQYEEETGEPISFSLAGYGGQQATIASALIAQWANVGIDATFEQTDQARLINDVLVGNYQAAEWRNHNWVDPDFNYVFWSSTTDAPNGELSINLTHTVTPELDEALNTGRASLDPEVRREAYDSVQRILNEELTHIWLFDAVWAVATKDSVHGFQDAADSNTISRLEPKTMWSQVWMEQ
jgi:peptide/nickel transport system substrate-binding protein